MDLPRLRFATAAEALCASAGVSVVFRGRARMAEIIQFRSKADIAEDNCEIDLMTAVDVAIRDLRDIAERWGDESVRIQAEECRRMLERAYDAAV